MLAKTGEYASSVLVDRDSNAIKFLQQRFADAAVSFLHMSFADAAEQLARQGRTFDIILADLGGVVTTARSERTGVFVFT